MTNFALPCLIIFRVCLYPRTYFPLFITSWSLELIDSSDFFVFFAATISGLSVGARPGTGRGARGAGACMAAVFDLDLETEEGSEGEGEGEPELSSAVSAPPWRY